MEDLALRIQQTAEKSGCTVLEVLAVLVAYNEVVGDTETAEALAALADALERLESDPETN